MASESNRVVLRLGRDPRLVGAVGGAVGHFAERAGLDPQTQADLVAAAEELCRQALPLLTGLSSVLEAAVEDFHDRIEVTLAYQGETLSGAVSKIKGMGLLMRVDRVLYDTKGGISRTTLVKFVPARTEPR